MHYDLKELIRESNKQAHIDMTLAMKKKEQGLLTLVLRVNSGNIVDLVELEYYTYQSNE